MGTRPARPQLLYERFLRSPDAEVVTFVNDDDSYVRTTARELTERAMAFAQTLGPVDRREARIAGIYLYHGIDLHAAFVGAL